MVQKSVSSDYKSVLLTPKRIAVISSFIIGACLLFYFLFFVFLSEPRLSVEYCPFIPGRERQYTKDRIETVYKIKENADFTYVSSRDGKKLEGPPGKYFIRNGCVFTGEDTPKAPALPLVKIGAKVGDKWSIPSTKTEGEIDFCFDKVEMHQGKSYVVVHQTYVYPNGNAWAKIVYYFYKGVGLVHRRNYRFDDRTQKWQLESELSYKEWEW